MSDQVAVLVSGPASPALRKAFLNRMAQWLSYGVTAEDVGRRRRQQERTSRLGDILRFSCPAEEGLLNSIIEGLRAEYNKLKRDRVNQMGTGPGGRDREQPIDSLGVWLRLPGTPLVQLESPESAHELLEVFHQTEMSEPSTTSEDYLKLSVVARGGQEKGKEFDEKVRAGMPAAEAAQEVMKNTNPLDHFEEIRFVV